MDAGSAAASFLGSLAAKKVINAQTGMGQQEPVPTDDREYWFRLERLKSKEAFWNQFYRTIPSRVVCLLVGAAIGSLATVWFIKK